MAYLRIPPSFLPNAIAKAVSKLEIELNTRVQAEAGKIVDRIRSEGCPADLARTVQKVQGLSNGVNKLNKRLQQFKKMPEIILIPIKILEKIAKDNQVKLVRTSDLICSDQNKTCKFLTYKNDKIMFDGNHFTVEGAKYLGVKIKELKWFLN